MGVRRFAHVLKSEVFRPSLSNRRIYDHREGIENGVTVDEKKARCFPRVALPVRHTDPGRASSPSRHRAGNWESRKRSNKKATSLLPQVA
jgi:hypothetical protein